MIKKAVIIAAGHGSRLKADGVASPKPLRRVAGLSLIARIILTAKKAGISEFVIVVGHEKEKIISKVKKENLGVRIDFAVNHDWEKSNGLSVLAAKPFIHENFVLLMADHVFDSQTLIRLVKTPLAKHKAVLAVDHNVKSIFDPDDATKVLVSGNDIHEIGKSLATYNAVDTGMFLATPALFDALENVKKNGDCSLSDGIRYLASKKHMGAMDIGEAFWQDVDTPASLKHAENELLDSCRKPTDGVISRNFNRHISLWITRGLLKTGISANHMTGLTSLVGLLSGIFVAKGNYADIVLGAFLFKLASILDGCDGEISKLKLSSSKTGEWLDTLSDNLTYLFFMVGVIFGLARQGEPHIIVMGTLTVLGLLMSLAIMFIYLIRRSNSGSLMAIQEDFKNSPQQGLVRRTLHAAQFMAKRDFFALLFLILAIFNRLDLILWLCMIGTNLMWMFLLNSRLGFPKTSTVVPRESHLR